MFRNMKAIAVTLVALLVLGLSVLAYAGANGGDAAKTPAAAGTAVTEASATGNGNAESVTANGSDEQEQAATEAESAEGLENEAGKAGGADPVEAPGTPGYEEGDFGGQHEF